MVSPATQREVYRTVKLRGRLIDRTWAAWLRAADTALYEAMVAEGRDKAKCDAWLARKIAQADALDRDDTDTAS